MSNLKAVIAEVESNAKAAVAELKKSQVILVDGKVKESAGEPSEAQKRKVVEAAVGNASARILAAVVDDVFATHKKAVSH